MTCLHLNRFSLTHPHELGGECSEEKLPEDPEIMFDQSSSKIKPLVAVEAWRSSALLWYNCTILYYLS